MVKMVNVVKKKPAEMGIIRNYGDSKHLILYVPFGHHNLAELTQGAVWINLYSNIHTGGIAGYDLAFRYEPGGCEELRARLTALVNETEQENAGT